MAHDTGMSGAIGDRNLRYYISTFNDIENAGDGLRPSFNWAAMVCSTGWFFYRRMFLFGAINLGLLLLVLAPQTMHLTPEESGIAGWALVVYAVVSFAVLPFVANWLYYRHLKARVAAGRGKAPDLLSFGLGAAAMTLAAAVSITSLAIATSVDHEVRLHVVDGLIGVAPYKAAVEASVKEKGVLPMTQADAPRVSPDRVPRGVKLADIGPGGVVRVAFTGFRHINGRGIEIVPTLNDKTVEWRCYNVDMPDKELPSQCRTKRAPARKVAAEPPAPAK